MLMPTTEGTEIQSESVDDVIVRLPVSAAADDDIVQLLVSAADGFVTGQLTVSADGVAVPSSAVSIARGLPAKLLLAKRTAMFFVNRTDDRSNSHFVLISIININKIVWLGTSERGKKRIGKKK